MCVVPIDQRDRRTAARHRCGHRLGSTFTLPTVNSGDRMSATRRPLITEFGRERSFQSGVGERGQLQTDCLDEGCPHAAQGLRRGQRRSLPMLPRRLSLCEHERELTQPGQLRFRPTGADRLHERLDPPERRSVQDPEPAPIPSPVTMPRPCPNISRFCRFWIPTPRSGACACPTCWEAASRS